VFNPVSCTPDDNPCTTISPGRRSGNIRADVVPFDNDSAIAITVFTKANAGLIVGDNVPLTGKVAAKRTCSLHLNARAVRDTGYSVRGDADVVALHTSVRPNRHYPCYCISGYDVPFTKRGSSDNVPGPTGNGDSQAIRERRITTRIDPDIIPLHGIVVSAEIDPDRSAPSHDVPILHGPATDRAVVDHSNTYSTAQHVDARDRTVRSHIARRGLGMYTDDEVRDGDIILSAESRARALECDRPVCSKNMRVIGD